MPTNHSTDLSHPAFWRFYENKFVLVFKISIFGGDIVVVREDGLICHPELLQEFNCGETADGTWTDGVRPSFEKDRTSRTVEADGLYPASCPSLGFEEGNWDPVGETLREVPCCG